MRYTRLWAAVLYDTYTISVPHWLSTKSEVSVVMHKSSVYKSPSHASIHLLLGQVRSDQINSTTRFNCTNTQHIQKEPLLDLLDLINLTPSTPPVAVTVAEATAEPELTEFAPTLTLGLTTTPFRFTAPRFGIPHGVILPWLTFAGRRQDSHPSTNIGIGADALPLFIKKEVED